MIDELADVGGEVVGLVALCRGVGAAEAAQRDADRPDLGGRASRTGWNERHESGQPWTNTTVMGVSARRVA